VERVNLYRFPIPEGILGTGRSGMTGGAGKTILFWFLSIHCHPRERGDPYR